jgi:hypothetical protein
MHPQIVFDQAGLTRLRSVLPTPTHVTLARRLDDCLKGWRSVVEGTDLAPAATRIGDRRTV